MNKFIDIALPTLLAFGPVFFMMGLPASPNMQFYNLLAGVLMMSIGGSLLFIKISKLEKRIEKLQNEKESISKG